MMQSYTEEDLIRFIYKEVEICEYFEIDHAIENDKNLQDEYQAIKDTVDILPKETFNPSSQSIKNILNYNKKSFMTSLV